MWASGEYSTQGEAIVTPPSTEKTKKTNFNKSIDKRIIVCYDEAEVINMTGRELIKEIMNERGITNALMANKLGVSQAVVWERLNNTKTRDIPLSTFCDMLRVMDCDLLVVPYGKGARIDGAKKVTVDEAARINNGGRKKGTKVANATASKQGDSE